MNFRTFRSRIAAWATFGLVATSLVAIAPAANADGIGGYSPTYYGFTRGESTPGSMLVKDGETVTISSEQSLDWDYAWPAPLKSVISRTAFTQTKASMAGLFSLSDSKIRYWSAQSSADPLCSELEENGGYIYQESTTFKIDAGNRCIDYLTANDSITVSNDTGSSKTVVTNAASQVLKVGKRNVNSVTGASRSFYGYVQTYDSADVTTVAGESSMSASFDLCLNEDLVDGNDELDIDVSWRLDGSPVSSDDLEVGYYDENGDAQMTIVVPEDNPYDQTFWFVVYLNTEDETGTHIATADITLNGSSVLEECPPAATEPAWPTIATVNGDGPQATTTSRTMPDDKFTGTNWDRYQVFPDGFGGAFHSGVSNDDGAGTVTLVQLGASGPQNSYNGTGGRNITSNSDGYFDFGRYGAAGANQFTLVNRAKGNWEYTTSTMTGATPVTRTLTKASLAKLCERGFAFNGMYALSIPTVNPTALLGCTKGNSYRQALVSIVNNVPAVTARFGAPTTAQPCSGTYFGSNSAATGTEVALIAYTRTMENDADGNCSGGDVAVSARSITTVTAAGAVSTSALTSSPWGDSGEPYYLQIAPGSSASEWVGMSFTRGEEWESIPANLFTMTGSAITEGQGINLDDTTDFGYYPQYDIVKKVSSSVWWISIDSGDMWHDGESIVRATVASVNTSTGAVTNGDVIELSGFGFYSGRTRGVFSGNGASGTTYFTMTGVDAYKTTTWSTD